MASPLTRAQETAARIAAVAGLDVEVDRRLIDRDDGAFTGADEAELMARFGRLDAAPGVEAWDTLAARVTMTLADVAGMSPGGPAMVVGHDAVNRAVLARCGTSTTIPTPSGNARDVGAIGVGPASGPRWSSTPSPKTADARDVRNLGAASAMPALPSLTIDGDPVVPDQHHTATAPLGERWFTPGVAGIGAASLLADVGHEVPTALLPSLLTSTLGAPASALGLIEGVSDALAGAARFGGGALADDPTRRRAVAVGGYTCTAVLSSAIGGATATWQVGLLRAGAWTARGLRVPARNALLADVTSPSAYGRAYGFERAMDNLGAVVGPLLALALVATLGVRWAIGLSLIPGLLATTAIVYVIRQTHAPTRPPRQPVRLRVRPIVHGPLGPLLVGIAAFEAGNCAATLLILRATELFEPNHTGDTPTQLALGLYIAYNVAATMTSIPAGRLSDRRGAVEVLVVGAGLFAAAYAYFAIGPSGVAALAPAFVLAGVGIGCAETAEHAAVAELAPVGLRGSAFGLLAGIQSIGNLVASAVAGLLWTALSPTAAFVFLAAAMGAAIVLIATARMTARR